MNCPMKAFQACPGVPDFGMMVVCWEMIATCLKTIVGANVCVVNTIPHKNRPIANDTTPVDA
jgi:hypothetical protein